MVIAAGTPATARAIDAGKRATTPRLTTKTGNAEPPARWLDATGNAHRYALILFVERTYRRRAPSTTARHGEKIFRARRRFLFGREGGGEQSETANSNERTSWRRTLSAGDRAFLSIAPIQGEQARFKRFYLTATTWAATVISQAPPSGPDRAIKPSNHLSLRPTTSLQPHTMATLKVSLYTSRVRQERSAQEHSHHSRRHDRSDRGFAWLE